jgi:hypothetical protein
VPQIFKGMLLAPLLSRMGNKKTRFFIANVNQKDLAFLKDLLEAGKVVPRNRSTLPVRRRRASSPLSRSAPCPRRDRIDCRT